MKIAIYHNLPSGGAKRAVHEVSRRLATRGHELWEFCPSTAVTSFLPLNDFISGKEVFNARQYVKTSKWTPLITPYLDLCIQLLNQNQMRQVSLRAAKMIDGMGFDVVYVHDCLISENPYILRYLKTPSIFYCHHGARAHLSAVAFEKNPVNKHDSYYSQCKKHYYAPAYALSEHNHLSTARSNAQAAGEVWTSSYFSRECLYSIYSIDSSVKRYGVDTDIFFSLGLPRENFLLAVGAIHPYKGYKFLIESLAEIPDNKRPQLVIAANSTDALYKSQLDMLAAKLHVKYQVRTIWNDKELMQLYNKALALVYTPVMEPFGLAALEAMACSTPVVAIREGGLRESVIDGVTGLTADRNVSMFAQVLRNLLADSYLRIRLGKSGREHVLEHWSWDAAVDAIEDGFQDQRRSD